MCLQRGVLESDRWWRCGGCYSKFFRKMDDWKCPKCEDPAMFARRRVCRTCGAANPKAAWLHQEVKRIRGTRKGDHAWRCYTDQHLRGDP